MNRPGRVRSCSFNHLLTTKMSNVEFIRTDFNEMLETTPFKPLLSEIKTSSWSVVQLSDIVRLIRSTYSSQEKRWILSGF